ncbi:MAG TPA: histidine phosphatase family protein [Mobilitalea sp.]|nr:histidine phosphatase family protein [Mobilitalea sp.]
MKIYLIRHGETDWNLQGRFQGREDIELNENGLRQARLCGEALQGEHFKAAISSPLVRASKTAHIIAQTLDIKEFIIDKNIIERDFSKVSGMTPKEREAFYASGEEDDKEPWDDLCRRMISSLKKYAERFKPDKIIMVSHGASINAVLSILSHGEIGTRKTVLKNTCINVIDYDNGSMTIDMYNMTPDEYALSKK